MLKPIGDAQSCRIGMLVVMRVELAELIWGLEAEWKADAACRGHADVFFPERDAGPHVLKRAYDAARLLCAGCPVLTQCKAEGDRLRDPHGFRAGESAMERRRRWKAEGPSPLQRERVERRRRVAELRALGLSYADIARRLGVSPSVVLDDANAVA